MPDVRAADLRSYAPLNRVKHFVRLGAKRLGLGPRFQRLRTPRPLDATLRLGRATDWPTAARSLLSPEGRATLALPQLLAYLVEDFVLDMEVELLLTEVRRQLLLGPPAVLDDSAIRSFASTLIRQCDLNEYTFYVSDEEAEHLAALEPLIAANSKETATAVLLTAMYVPVRELLTRLSPALDVETLEPDAFRGFVREELDNLREERQIASSIPQHGEITDDVSRLVAGQYELNPYPRWTRMDVSPGARAQHVKAYFDPSALRFLERPFKVLIGGCATGKHAIRCGVGYGANAQVLAIDLSVASLTYASRMAKRHGVNNVRFLRCDIMEAPTLPDRFEIIESQGVLLTMADPMKGWKALVDVLKPGGLMYIALYSRLGRHHVNTCRQEIAELGFTAGTADQMRRYRRELILRYGPSRLWQREEYFPFGRDFFSLSNCRDLLFMVNEHQHTIPQIKAAMATLGLRFHGFVPPPIPPNRLWPRYPDPADIDGWWEFEQDNIETFGHAYEFWCRKE